MMDTSARARDPAADRYLDLLKGCLTRLLFIGEEVQPFSPVVGWKKSVFSVARTQLARFDAELITRPIPDRSRREEGRDWPAPLYAETMIGMRRLDNLQRCVQDVLFTGVPGDVLEAGVWRGGAGILMRAVLAAHGDTDRTVWLADSFEGLPKPDAERYPSDANDPHSQYDDLAVSVDQVKANLARYALLDEQVKFLVGWFKDSLPDAPIDQLSVLRLDGDMYESTIDVLAALYPKLSPGGYLIVDDYSNPQTPGCKTAVDDYRRDNGITEPIETVDWTGVFWKKA
jgi:O-methyltransferase